MFIRKLRKMTLSMVSLLLLTGFFANTAQAAGRANKHRHSFLQHTAATDTHLNNGTDAFICNDETNGGTGERFTILIPEHDGLKEKRSKKAVIDYSHAEDGYFMVQRLENTKRRYKVLVKIQNLTYTYTIDNGEWATFPFSEGNGLYKISVHENISGTKYANVVSASVQVNLIDPFSPFLRPNQHVNYLNAPNTMEKGASLTEGCEGPLGKVDAVYTYVTKSIKYDYVLASTVESGYLPDLDLVLKKKRGICYDYSSLMSAMLRSQNVPCKLVFGYVGKLYHAWISVWVDEEGWVKVIYFDGHSWQRMDPTFAAAGTTEDEVKKQAGNGKYYAVKYSF